MRKKMRSVIAIIVCLCVLFTALPVFAKEATSTFTYNGTVYKISVVEDLNGTRTVNVQSKEGVNTIVYDQKNNTAQVQLNDLKGKNIYSKSVALNSSTKITHPTTDGAVQQSSLLNCIASNDDLNWGHYYQCWTQTGPYQFNWYLRSHGSNKYFIDETSSNTTDLNTFKSDVDSAKTYTYAAIALAGAALVSAIIGILLAIPTVGISAVIAAFVAVGCALAAAPAILSAWQSARDADFRYARV